VSERLDQALERERRRVDPSSIKPVQVRNLDDIRRVLAEFEPKQSEAPSVMVNANVDGHDCNIMTKSKSKREQVLEGMNVVRSQMKVITAESTPPTIDGKEGRRLTIGGNGLGYHWVDPIIKAWLGAERRGLDIVWTLQGVEYVYDIFAHSLKRK
jgi:hypothetical protein